MLLLTSSDLIVKNIFTGFKANGIALPTSEEQFRPLYQKFLSKMQPQCIWLRESDKSLSDDLMNDKNQILNGKLSNIFNGEVSELDDMNQTNVIKKQPTSSSNAIAIQALTEALNLMYNLTPLHRKFLELCIERIFIESSEDASGGSTSNAIGLIWANPHPQFAANDVIELLVHELTHNLLFLDEWVHRHYDYPKIILEEKWSKSAILKRKRPLDKVVHSLVVSAELVLLRREFLGEPSDPKAHPPSDCIEDAIKDSIHELRKIENIQDCVYPRVWQLISLIENRIF